MHEHHTHSDADGPGRRGPRRRPGSGPSLGPDLGPRFVPGFGPGGPGRFRRRGGRAARGDVRAALLLLLEEQPMHGYQLIQHIGERSSGVWTPSPGSVYPALQQLEDEGLIRFERVDGRKTASLTEAGTAFVEARRAELGAPWDDVSGGVGTEARDVRELVASLAGAAHQVVHVGSPEQASQAAEVLTEARRSLYRILAGDAPQA